MMRVIIKRMVSVLARTLPRLPGGEYALHQLLESGMNARGVATHAGVSMVFPIPNALCRYRVTSFSTKEPETLEWIESMPYGSVMWDVGANIGLYSVYAAKVREANVIAFEPSVFNLELLARSVFLNSLQQRVLLVPVALDEKTGASVFKMSTTAWGGALSTFGQDYGQDGRALADIFAYRTCGVSMRDAVDKLGLPMPQFIKIDVDGIEHLILRGGAAILGQADSVLVEINDDFAAQAAESSMHLSAAGLTLKRKCGLNAGNQYNQWWVRHPTGTGF